MLLFAHTGIPLGVAWLLQRSLDRAKPQRSRLSLSQVSHPSHCPVDKTFANLDFRLFLLGSMLPDIIDKPLGIWLLRDALSNGRVFGHTLLFALLLLVVGAYLFAKDGRRNVLFLSFGSITHLCLDEMWQNPTTLLWPLYGWSLERTDVSHWLKRILTSLATEPSAYIPEIIGALLIAFFLASLVHHGKLYHFIRTGGAV